MMSSVCLNIVMGTGNSRDGTIGKRIDFVFTKMDDFLAECGGV